MKVIDEKGRIFGLINYIDLIFILAIVFIIGRFILTDNQENNNKILNTDTAKEIEVLFFVNGVKDVSMDTVNVGDVFRITSNNNTIGEVIKKEIKPSSIMTTDEKGNVIHSQIPDRFDMYLTIKGKGEVTENDIKIGNEDLKIGKTLLIQSRMNRLEATVYGIEYK